MFELYRMPPEQQFVIPTGKTEEQIIRYLLDESRPEERLQLEERLVSDSSFFDVISSVEDDLIIGYIRGELPEPLLLRFSEVYLNNPVKLARIEAARALRTAVQEVSRTRRPEKTHI